MGWVDSHCHLQPEHQERPGDRRSQDHDPAELVARARAAGVDWMVCVGTDLATSREAVALAHEHTDVVAAVGLHPHDAQRFGDEWEALAALARSDERVVAVGEAGFDLHYRHSEPAEQERAFRAHIALAHELDRALVIHTREAWDDTLRVLEAEGVPRRTVFHCFTGGPAEAERCLALGAHLSFSGIVSFKTADELRAAAARTPLDRLLVETDSPYLAPVPHRGTPNEPAYVPLVGAAVAAVRGIDAAELAAVTAANAERVFRA